MDSLNIYDPGHLAFGGASISGNGNGAGGGYGFGEISDELSRDLLLFAYENNINIFDSAPIYGFGNSEVRIGKALRKVREKVHFISKSGVTWDKSHRVDMSNNPKLALQMFEESLKNFNCDYIDLYMVHWPDPKVDIRFVLEIFENLKASGKIKHIGLCNTNEEDLLKSKEVCSVEVVQCEYNLFNNQSYENLMIKFPDLKFMGWGTFDKGILSERVTKKIESNKNYNKFDCRKKAPWWKQKDVLKKVDFVEQFSKNMSFISENIQMSEFAFQFSKNKKSIPLIGAKSIEDLESVLEWNCHKKDINRLFELWKNDKS